MNTVVDGGSYFLSGGYCESFLFASSLKDV
jgi:hypothetical protein